MRRKAVQVLLTLNLLVLLNIALKTHLLSPASTSRGMSHTGQFRLLDLLHSKGHPNYTIKNLYLQDFLAQDGNLYFLVSQGSRLGSPAAVVRAAPSGEILAFTALPPSLREYQMAVDRNGKAVVVEPDAKTLQVYGADGTLESSLASELALDNFCRSDPGLQKLCPLDPRLREHFGAWHPYMLRITSGNGRFGVVDGSKCVLYVGENDTGENLESFPLSNPELDEAQRRTAAMYAAQPRSSTTPAFIIDAEIYNGTLYLLLGSGSSGLEGVLMKYNLRGQFLGTLICRLPKMTGAWRVNPEKAWCLDLHFLAIDAGCVYLADDIGNVLVFALV